MSSALGSLGPRTMHSFGLCCYKISTLCGTRFICISSLDRIKSSKFANAILYRLLTCDSAKVSNLKSKSPNSYRISSDKMGKSDEKKSRRSAEKEKKARAHKSSPTESLAENTVFGRKDRVSRTPTKGSSPRSERSSSSHGSFKRKVSNEAINEPKRHAADDNNLAGSSSVRTASSSVVLALEREIDETNYVESLSNDLPVHYVDDCIGASIIIDSHGENLTEAWALAETQQGFVNHQEHNADNDFNIVTQNQIMALDANAREGLSQDDILQWRHNQSRSPSALSEPIRSEAPPTDYFRGPVTNTQIATDGYLAEASNSLSISSGAIPKTYKHRDQSRACLEYQQAPPLAPLSRSSNFQVAMDTSNNHRVNSNSAAQGLTLSQSRDYSSVVRSAQEVVNEPAKTYPAKILILPRQFPNVVMSDAMGEQVSLLLEREEKRHFAEGGFRINTSKPRACHGTILVCVNDARNEHWIKNIFINNKDFGDHINVVRADEFNVPPAFRIWVPDSEAAFNSSLIYLENAINIQREEAGLADLNIIQGCRLISKIVDKEEKKYARGTQFFFLGDENCRQYSLIISSFRYGYRKQLATFRKLLDINETPTDGKRSHANIHTRFSSLSFKIKLLQQKKTKLNSLGSHEALTYLKQRCFVSRARGTSGLASSQRHGVGSVSSKPPLHTNLSLNFIFVLTRINTLNIEISETSLTIFKAFSTPELNSRTPVENYVIIEFYSVAIACELTQALFKLRPEIKSFFLVNFQTRLSTLVSNFHCTESEFSCSVRQTSFHPQKSSKARRRSK